MRILTTLFLSVLWLASLTAQRFVPLQEQPALQERYRMELEQLPFQQPERLPATKTDCTFELEGLTPAIAGLETRLGLSLDTTGLSGPSAEYRCLNCGEAAFGTASVDSNQLVYQAAPDVIEGFDTLRVTFCNPDLNQCSDTTQLVLYARRANRTFRPDLIDLAPGASQVLSGNPDSLPGPLFCSSLIDLEDEYGGRDQLFFFVGPDDPDFRFLYQASRFPGIDSIRLELCTNRGICDEYRFAIRIPQTIVSLPFFDDFSTEGLSPDPNRWLDREVLINDGYPQKPPSIGVATFDAIDFRGQPYTPSPGIIRPKDRLTSVPIDLSTAGPPVLSFYLQPRGLGDRPEIRDSFRVEFRNQKGEWESVRAFEGLPTNSSLLQEQPFRFYQIAVPDAFRYNGFQFRFSSESEESGALDIWNLDYVLLDDIQTDSTLADIAFTEPASSPFNPYSAIPYRQLRAGGSSLLNDTIRVGIWNHDNEALSVINSSIEISERTTNLPLLQATLFNGQEANILNGEPLTRSYQLDEEPPFNSQFGPYRDLLIESDQFDPNARLEIRNRYTLVNTSQIATPGLSASILRNDTTERTILLDNFYAYDDGSAELALEALPNQSIVQRYEAFVPEVLRGFSIRFPRNTTNFSGQTIRFVVYLDTLDDSPEYSFDFQPVLVESFTDTLQGFTTFTLDAMNGPVDSLLIPTGDFYVGWQQVTNCNICVPVGFDRQNNTNNRIFFRNTGDWFELPGPITGTLMIRPFVGDEAPPATTDVEERDAPTGLSQLALYPNPSGDQVHFRIPGGYLSDPDSWIVQVVNGTGQPVFQQRGLRPFSVATLPNGLYWVFLRQAENGITLRKKLVVFR